MNSKHSLIIAFSAVLCVGALHGQTAEEGKAFGKAWLGRTCTASGNEQEDRAAFVKYKVELQAYFVSAIQKGLELNGMQDEELALGKIYDSNLKTLNERKAAWMTVEHEAALRAVTKEVFITREKQVLSETYKIRASIGLEFIKSLSSCD